MRAVSGFVMVLGYSRAIAALFTLDQTLESFLRGHVDAFDAFDALGGVARTLVYDNLRSAVLDRRGAAVQFHPRLLDTIDLLYYTLRMAMGAITPPRRRSIGTSGASPRPGAPRSWAGRTRSASQRRRPPNDGPAGTVARWRSSTSANTAPTAPARREVSNGIREPRPVHAEPEAEPVITGSPPARAREGSAVLPLAPPWPP